MGKVYCHIIALSCISCTKPYLVFLLICFAQKIKGLDFMRKWGWFHGHVIRFTKNLSSRLKHQKTKIRFCRSKNNVTTTLISSCHWKTLVPFNLRKKRPENAFLKLTVNCRKIMQQNNLYHPNQQEIGYLMIYDFL